jgi:hypothetical protein
MRMETWTACDYEQTRKVVGLCRSVIEPGERIEGQEKREVSRGGQGRREPTNDSTNKIYGVQPVTVRSIGGPPSQAGPGRPV